MKDLLSYSRAWLVVAGVLAIGVGMLIALTGHAAAQPATFLSPLGPQQTTPFLSVPYYGPKRLTAYFDHEFPNYQINNRIVLYDGRVIPSTNGACAWNNAGQAIGYCAVSGQVPCVSCILYEGHSGNDFSLDYEPVLAAADGTVIRAGWQNWNDRYAGLGLHLIITHTNGYETRYGHLSALTVITNAPISRGQIIGSSGNTGDSTGSHLHFEVRLNGAPHRSLWRGGIPMVVAEWRVGCTGPLGWSGHASIWCSPDSGRRQPGNRG
jgi:murein DD-endopeptidase MepM/ murein hydrolase activator NlpD